MEDLEYAGTEASGQRKRRVMLAEWASAVTVLKTCSQVRAEAIPVLFKNFRLMAFTLSPACWFGAKNVLFARSIRYMDVEDTFVGLLDDTARPTMIECHLRYFKQRVRYFPNLDFLRLACCIFGRLVEYPSVSQFAAADL